MSEYQYYEFLAIDRPLDADEQAKVRSRDTGKPARRYTDTPSLPVL